MAPERAAGATEVDETLKENNESSEVHKVEHLTYKELISFLDEYSDLKIADQKLFASKQTDVTTRHVALCEKSVTVNMMGVLNRLLKHMFDEANPLYETEAYADLLAETASSEHLIDLNETFSFYKQNKLRCFDSIDDLEYYRLKTNLKGKKTQSLKKNVQCQTFETAAEADQMLRQTREFFDFFLNPIDPSPVDVSSMFAAKLHNIHESCFMLTCRPICGVKLSDTNKNCDITFQKLHNKRKVFKIPHFFSCTMSPDCKSMRVSPQSYIVWLSSLWGTISN